MLCGKAEKAKSSKVLSQNGLKLTNHTTNTLGIYTFKENRKVNNGKARYHLLFRCLFVDDSCLVELLFLNIFFLSGLEKTEVELKMRTQSVRL